MHWRFLWQRWLRDLMVDHETTREKSSKGEQLVKAKCILLRIGCCGLALQLP